MLTLRRNSFIGSKYLPESIYGETKRIPKIFDTEGICIFHGRNVIKKFVSRDGRTFIVKRFKKPSLIQAVGIPFRGTKAERAFINAERLIERGFHTPKPLACLSDENGYSYLVTAEDMGRPVCEAFSDPTRWKGFAEAFARYTYALHGAGIIHRDYNSTNIRFTFNENEPRYTFSLIDINRMSFYTNLPPLWVRLKNLFLFSFCDDSFKEVLKHYLTVSHSYNYNLYEAALAEKQKHDRNWDRKKKFLSYFKRLSHLWRGRK